MDSLKEIILKPGNNTVFKKEMYDFTKMLEIHLESVKTLETHLIDLFFSMRDDIFQVIRVNEYSYENGCFLKLEELGFLEDRTTPLDEEQKSRFYKFTIKAYSYMLQEFYIVKEFPFDKKEKRILLTLGVFDRVIKNNIRDGIVQDQTSMSFAFGFGTSLEGYQFWQKTKERLRLIHSIIRASEINSEEQIEVEQQKINELEKQKLMEQTI